MAPVYSESGLIIRQKEPVNLETPLDQVDSFLTPAELFYIRSHFPAPDLTIETYRLEIAGAVREPCTLIYQDLREMPSETRIATLECAGNCRVFLVPQVPGTQWELGAVGTAEWTGVPLAALLERAGVDAEACEVVAAQVELRKRSVLPGHRRWTGGKRLATEDRACVHGLAAIETFLFHRNIPGREHPAEGPLCHHITRHHLAEQAISKSSAEIRIEHDGLCGREG